MPLEKAQARARFLKKIREAIKEAEAAGVDDALELVKKIVESKKDYLQWKYGKKRN